MNDILKDVDAHVDPSFSLANRLKRAVWNVMYILLFRFSPRSLHAWRVFLLRLFGAKIGKACHVYPKAIIWAPWNLDMGDYSCFADGVLCYSMAKITIGRKVVVSQDTKLITGTHDYDDERFPLLVRPISVGDKVWIASDVFVFPDVVIPEGVVVGARAVVTKDLEAWKVYAGNPCTMIKERKRMEKNG